MAGLNVVDEPRRLGEEQVRRGGSFGEHAPVATLECRITVVKRRPSNTYTVRLNLQRGDQATHGDAPRHQHQKKKEQCACTDRGLQRQR